MTDPRPSGWTPTNVFGFILAAAGLALGFWSKADGTLTTPMYLASAVLIGAGMWCVSPGTAAGFFAQVEHVAEPFLPPGADRAGRRDTDAVVVPAVNAPAVVAPAVATPAPKRRRSAPAASAPPAVTPPRAAPSPPVLVEDPPGLSDDALARLHGVAPPADTPEAL